MKRLWYLLYILIVVVVLIPKEKLYYTAESALEPYGITINGEKATDHWFWFDAEEGEVMVDDLKMGTIERVRLIPALLYNRLSVTNITLSPQYRSFVPSHIDSIALTYSILHPLSVQIESTGDFGTCRGSVDLVEQKIRVVFDATPQLRRYPLLVYKLQQDEEGLVYEDSF